MDIEALKKALIENTCVFADTMLNLVEIGDGNINRVFRASLDNGESYVIKYAPARANISSSIRLNQSRGRTESNYLKALGRLMPAFVPALIEYSDKCHCIVMQDLTAQYNVLQQEIIKGKSFDFLAQQLAAYTAVAGYAFSDFSLSSRQKEALQKGFYNPKLCALTERLVFTEPYYDCMSNSFSEKNRDFVTREIYKSSKVEKSIKKLKTLFMHCPQSLIHGDLHFGSVFVSDKDIKIFDPEFCFFGPIGYDLGNLLAHFILHYVYHSIKKTDNTESVCFWLKQQAICLITEFVAHFLEQAGYDTTASTEQKRGIFEFLQNVLSATAGFAGTECIRRTVGLAKVSAFVFNDQTEQAQYELAILSIGKYLLENFEAFTTAHVFEEELNILLR